jgi:hypothetical protein
MSLLTFHVCFSPPALTREMTIAQQLGFFTKILSPQVFSNCPLYIDQKIIRSSSFFLETNIARLLCLCRRDNSISRRLPSCARSRSLSTFLRVSPSPHRLTRLASFRLHRAFRLNLYLIEALKYHLIDGVFLCPNHLIQ